MAQPDMSLRPRSANTTTSPRSTDHLAASTESMKRLALENIRKSPSRKPSTRRRESGKTENRFRKVVNSKDFSSVRALASVLGLQKTHARDKSTSKVKPSKLLDTVDWMSCDPPLRRQDHVPPMERYRTFRRPLPSRPKTLTLDTSVSTASPPVQSPLPPAQHSPAKTLPPATPREITSPRNPLESNTPRNPPEVIRHPSEPSVINTPRHSVVLDLGTPRTLQGSPRHNSLGLGTLPLSPRLLVPQINTAALQETTGDSTPVLSPRGSVLAQDGQTPLVEGDPEVKEGEGDTKNLRKSKGGLGKAELLWGSPDPTPRGTLARDLGGSLIVAPPFGYDSGRCLRYQLKNLSTCTVLHRAPPQAEHLGFAPPGGEEGAGPSGRGSPLDEPSENAVAKMWERVVELEAETKIERHNLAVMYKNFHKAATGSGNLRGRRELQRLMPAGWAPSDRVLQRLWQMLDQDKSADVTFEEFVRGLKRISDFEKMQDMKELFDALDLNDDGFINKFELNQVLATRCTSRDLFVRLSAQVEAVFNCINWAAKNISFHEFCEMAVKEKELVAFLMEVLPELHAQQSADDQASLRFSRGEQTEAPTPDLLAGRILRLRGPQRSARPTRSSPLGSPRPTSQSVNLPRPTRAGSQPASQSTPTQVETDRRPRCTERTVDVSLAGWTLRPMTAQSSRQTEKPAMKTRPSTAQIATTRTSRASKETSSEFPRTVPLTKSAWGASGTSRGSERGVVGNLDLANRLGRTASLQETSSRRSPASSLRASRDQNSPRGNVRGPPNEVEVEKRMAMVYRIHSRNARLTRQSLVVESPSETRFELWKSACDKVVSVCRQRRWTGTADPKRCRCLRSSRASGAHLSHTQSMDRAGLSHSLSLGRKFLSRGCGAPDCPWRKTPAEATEDFEPSVIVQEVSAGAWSEGWKGSEGGVRTPGHLLIGIPTGSDLS